PIKETLRMSALAASIAVSRPGATPSIPYMEEVLKVL
ncbi:MAG: ribokinase, partial [Frisingicoccus sp.]|nr:ribokinase [Frisingicoccus sp.]